MRPSENGNQGFVLSPKPGPAAQGQVSMASAMTFMRDRITLRQLRLLLVLNEARTASAAAQRLCISQPAVSKARAEIEAAIGAPIFVRRGNQTEATPLGQRLVEAARKILGELEAASEDFVLMQGGVVGTVQIGLRSIAAQPVVAKALTRFKAQYPHVTIKLLDQPVPTLLDRLAKNEISFVVSAMEQPELHPEFERVQVLADSTVVIAHPAHPLAREKHLDWPELLDQPWCLVARGSPPRSYFDAMIIERRLSYPTDVIEVNSFLMAVTIVQDSHYLTLVRQTTGLQLMRKSLAKVLRAPQLAGRERVDLIWNTEAPMSPSARLLHRFLLDTIANEPGAAEAAMISSSVAAACR
ncbi:hypothetical protein EOS_34015 [Caballeronia mineralivorans PML1(12)]|uniref:HTH lysR-type domain-containing protein n=1 Tax=Caballeronia mineralivorans PML1(12) TaxID=908627 RepID=A0A0J1CMP5_9BURK|nr:LysR family transcriptional regulator [Caballeronia mineralivorans]KLU21799.1 hypothetical protein EOS_34015 [Caballeronia mineralivorans PML1(12)]